MTKREKELEAVKRRIDAELQRADDLARRLQALGFVLEQRKPARGPKAGTRSRGKHTCRNWTREKDPTCLRCLQILAAKKQLENQFPDN